MSVIQHPTEVFYRAENGTEAWTPSTPMRKRYMVERQDGERCKICGREDFDTGVLCKEGGIVSDGFGELFAFRLPQSPIVCPYCEYSIQNEHRMISTGVVATPDKSYKIGSKTAKEGMYPAFKAYELLLEPPEPPFIFALNRGALNRAGKGGHFIHMAKVNYSRDKYFVSIFGEQVLVDRKLLVEFDEAVEGNYDYKKNLLRNILMISHIRKMTSFNSGGNDSSAIRDLYKTYAREFRNGEDSTSVYENILRILDGAMSDRRVVRLYESGIIDRLDTWDNIQAVSLLINFGSMAKEKKKAA